MEKITDVVLIAAVLAYCREHRIPCWAVHVSPESTIGGLSCELLSIGDGTAEVRIASGDVYTHPLAEIHLTAA